MENTNWLRQTPGKPLFPDVLWSRPENRRHAGKLLIIGGHAQSFSAVSEAFIAASKAGAGTVRILLPDSLRNTVGKAFPEADFAASTSIGSFSQKALAHMVDSSEWADAVLLAGDFGRNSETAILLEKFIDRYLGLLCLSGDSLDYFFDKPAIVLQRQNTVVSTDVLQLQKLAQPQAAIRQQSDLAQLVKVIGSYSDGVSAEIAAYRDGQVIVAVKGRVSTTGIGEADPEVLAAYVSVWRLQQPERAFEALTTAAYCL